MERDKFWEESVPKELPYTLAALPFRHQSDLSFSARQHREPQPQSSVYMFRPRGEELRKASVPSLHSFVSSIKGVLRRTSTGGASIWSSETGVGSVIPERRFLSSTPICDQLNFPKKSSICSTAQNLLKHGVISELEEQPAVTERKERKKGVSEGKVTRQHVALRQTELEVRILAIYVNRLQI